MRFYTKRGIKYFMCLLPYKRNIVQTWERRQKTSVPLVHLQQPQRTNTPYLLPKDEKEINRLDYQHHIFHILLQGKTFAPVDDLLKMGGNILDVGCGTGLWGREIATAYTRTDVIGFDLANVSRTTSIPLNYHFQGGNLLMGLPFQEQQFQYVHQRLLVAGIPLDQWPFVVSELRRVTSRGGWVELIEMGTTFHNAGPATQQFLQWWAAISATRGIDASKVAYLGKLLEDSGFSNVLAHTEIVPVGSWGGRIGKLLAQDILTGWPNVRSFAETLLQVSPDHFDMLLGQLEAEWNMFHTSYEVYFVCGQR